MKKNLLTAAAIMVTAFLVATTVAQAADVKLGGEFWTRYELNEQHDFNNATEADDFVQSRVRLHADVAINDSTSAFIQLQSNRTWGGSVGSGGTTSSNATPAGDGNGSFAVNDQDASVGIGQAYFTLKNFATLPVDLKVGKQQIILDGHRLFGNTVWTIGQNNHDATRLTHKHDNMQLDYAWIIATEDGAPTGNNVDDRNDIEVHVAYFKYEGILGGAFSTTYAYLQDGCGSSPTSTTVNCTNLEDDIHTIGFRQAGQLFGIDYRGEYYYQWGDASATALGGSITTGYTSGTPVDRDAYMFGVRVGKTFNNVSMKPGLTLWYDYLSGTSDDDAANNDYKSFNTLFDTGHKFYGLNDIFLGVGTNNTASGTGGFGLQDLAIKAKLNPMPGWTFKAHYHWFWTAEGVAGSNGRSGLAGNSSDLGNELDLILVNKYNANTKINIGYSNFTTTAALRGLRSNVGADSADWAYVQFQVNF
jgi:hypothetical protein